MTEKKFKDFYDNYQDNVVEAQNRVLEIEQGFRKFPAYTEEKLQNLINEIESMLQSLKVANIDSRVLDDRIKPISLHF